MYDCGDMENENYGIFVFTLPQKLPESKKVEQSLSVFSSAQNKANENLCLLTAHVSNNICENLCFVSDFSYDPDEEYKFNTSDKYGYDKLHYNQKKNEECKNICMLASDLEVEEDCPFRERCPNGCPCLGYKCLEDVLDFDLARFYFDSYATYDMTSWANRKSLYKISLEANTVKFEELSTKVDNHLAFLQLYTETFCIVAFRGEHYLIQAEIGCHLGKYKLQLFQKKRDKHQGKCTGE